MLPTGKHPNRLTDNTRNKITGSKSRKRLKTPMYRHLMHHPRPTYAGADNAAELFNINGRIRVDNRLYNILI